MNPTYPENAFPGVFTGRLLPALIARTAVSGAHAGGDLFSPYEASS